MAAMGTLEQELQKIYDSEINSSISWMWDAGFDLKLGDEFGGFVEEGQVRSVAAYFPGSKKQSRNAIPLPSITSKGCAEYLLLSSLPVGYCTGREPSHEALVRSHGAADGCAGGVDWVAEER